MTQLFNNGEYIITERIKVGDKVKALDLLNMGKDGKPTLKLVIIDSINPNQCHVCQVQPKGNVLEYSLCVFDMSKEDMTQATLCRQLATQPLSIAVWEQSTGSYTEDKKPIKRRVYFVLDANTNINKDNITRIKGQYFDTYEEEKEYIDNLLKQGYYFIEK